ncbi:hypothetical protein [Arthrobacter sp. ov118]|uniref:hypothetical protein n=1 Tax=Arthrobacter sp. ov118 TaxID=1761747 RepID=UPI0008EB1109|nr:hypothetical protein [Arthrobacter sp. ov118]SFU11904.1 hypothetical protein SAMN04487915_111185 [Arthrobacter sp. ov118]
MTAYRQNSWSHLIGAFVEIRRNNQVFRTGFVDDVMPDSSALWLAADQNHSRILFDAAQGFEVWVESRELEGQGRYRMTACALDSNGDYSQLRTSRNSTSARENPSGLFAILKGLQPSHRREASVLMSSSLGTLPADNAVKAGVLEA